MDDDRRPAAHPGPRAVYRQSDLAAWHRCAANGERRAASYGTALHEAVEAALAHPGGP